VRFLCGLIVLVGLGLASVSAQDPFGGVPVEPRPSEYILWNAENFTDFKNELEGQLRDGDGLWGTPLVVATALPQTDDRPHDGRIVHRAGYTLPEIHATKWDIYVVLDGSGMVRIGGERVNWNDGQPPAGQRPQLSGAQEFQVTKGDMLHVPARVWHQMMVEDGKSITYALIGVSE